MARIGEFDHLSRRVLRKYGREVEIQERNEAGNYLDIRHTTRGIAIKEGSASLTWNSVFGNEQDVSAIVFVPADTPAVWDKDSAPSDRTSSLVYLPWDSARDEDAIIDAFDEGTGLVRVQIQSQNA